MYVLIAILAVTLVTLAITHKSIMRFIAEKRALPIVEDILFSENNNNKEEILREIQELTNYRLNDDLVMDYFYKIKGLQVVNINQPTNFWVKMYLTSPTKIKLNYFEQVKFYENFLNYASSQKTQKESKLNKTASSFERKVKAQLLGNLIPQKLA